MAFFPLRAHLSSVQRHFKWTQHKQIEFKKGRLWLWEDSMSWVFVVLTFERNTRLTFVWQKVSQAWEVKGRQIVWHSVLLALKQTSRVKWICLLCRAHRSKSCFFLAVSLSPLTPPFARGVVDCCDTRWQVRDLIPPMNTARSAKGFAVVLLVALGGWFLFYFTYLHYRCIELWLLHRVPQMIDRSSKAPRSKLILRLWQHIFIWARAEWCFPPSASPDASPSACPLPPDQISFDSDTTSATLAAAAVSAPLVWRWGWTCTGTLWSRYLSWPRQRCVDRLFPVCGAVRLRYAGWVSDGSVQRPLGRPHVRKGGVQPRSLARMGVVWPRALVVGVFCKLSSWGQRGEGRAVVRKAEGGVSDVGTCWSCFHKVTRSTSGLTLNLGFGGIWAQRGAMVLLWRLLLLLGEPGCWVSTGRCQSWGDPIGVRRGRSSCCGSCSPRTRPNPWVPIRGKVLIKLIDIKRLHISHYLMTHLTNVHVTKVDMRFPRPRSTWASFRSHCTTRSPVPGSLPLTISCLCRLRLGLGSSGRCWRTVALTCGKRESSYSSFALQIHRQLPKRVSSCSVDSGITVE